MWFSEVLIPLLTAVLGVGALAWLLAWIRRHNHAVPEDAGLWQGGDYVCPRCGAAMAQGWVMLGKGAIFSPRAQGRPGLFAHIGRALPNTISLHFRPAANMAWHCSACRLLLIDHDKLVH